MYRQSAKKTCAILVALLMAFSGLLTGAIAEEGAVEAGLGDTTVDVAASGEVSPEIPSQQDSVTEPVETPAQDPVSSETPAQDVTIPPVPDTPAVVENQVRWYTVSYYNLYGAKITDMQVREGDAVGGPGFTPYENGLVFQYWYDASGSNLVPYQFGAAVTKSFDLVPYYLFEIVEPEVPTAMPNDVSDAVVNEILQSGGTESQEPVYVDDMSENVVNDILNYDTPADEPVIADVGSVSADDQMRQVLDGIIGTTPENVEVMPEGDATVLIEEVLNIPSDTVPSANASVMENDQAEQVINEMINAVEETLAVPQSDVSDLMEEILQQDHVGAQDETVVSSENTLDVPSVTDVVPGADDRIASILNETSEEVIVGENEEPVNVPDETVALIDEMLDGSAAVETDAGAAEELVSVNDGAALDVVMPEDEASDLINSMLEEQDDVEASKGQAGVGTLPVPEVELVNTPDETDALIGEMLDGSAAVETDAGAAEELVSMDETTADDVAMPEDEANALIGSVLEGQDDAAADKEQVGVGTPPAPEVKLDDVFSAIDDRDKEIVSKPLPTHDGDSENAMSQDATLTLIDEILSDGMTIGGEQAAEETDEVDAGSAQDDAEETPEAIAEEEDASEEIIAPDQEQNALIDEMTETESEVADEEELLVADEAQDDDTDGEADVLTEETADGEENADTETAEEQEEQAEEEPEADDEAIDEEEADDEVTSEEADEEEAADEEAVDDETDEVDAEVEEEPTEDDALPEDEEAIASSQPTVEVRYSYNGKLEVGTEVTVSANVQGMPEGVTPQYQWQNNASGVYQNVAGATGVAHTFTADEGNTDCQWRVSVTFAR